MSEDKKKGSPIASPSCQENIPTVKGNDQNLPVVIEPRKVLSEKEREFRSYELAVRMIRDSNYLPKHIKKREDAMSVVLWGREIGVPPMEALKNIYSVEGRFELDYTLVLALIYRNFPGTVIEYLTPLEDRKKECHILCTSPQRGQNEAKIDIKEYNYIADKGSKPQYSPWRRHPERMLVSKAVKLIADMMFADVVSGGPPSTGPLLSNTNKTLEETEAEELTQKPKFRTDTLTEDERASRNKQLDDLKGMDEHEKDAQAMEAQWEKESQPSTLQ